MAPIPERADGLIVGEPFLVIQLFDHEGYFGSAVGQTLAAVRARAERRSRSKSIVVCSLPFRGMWSNNTPNVSAPHEFKAALDSFERNAE